MKITKVDIERFSVPLAEPFRVAFGLLTDSDNWIIRVHTDEGIIGLGSAAPLAFVTGETMDTCRLVLELFAEAFIGFDPLDIAGAHRLMDSLIYGNGSAKCRETINHPNAHFLDDINPEARWMFPLAEQSFNREEFRDVAYFEPYYLKDFIAVKPKKLV